MVTETVEGVDPVFGQAQRQLESSGSSAMLPFLFCLVPSDPHHLRLCISDFHDQTWQGDFSVEELQDLRDEVGIGGSWKDFLDYVSTALSSDSVKLVLGGPANATCSHDATSAQIVAQKARGTPRLSLPVLKLKGLDADDAKGSISLGLFQAFHAQYLALVSERALVTNLTAALASEKNKVEKLQEQVEASSMTFASRTKMQKTSQLPFDAIVSQASLPLTQFESQAVLPALSATPAGRSGDKKEAAVKPPAPRSRVHVAPASRRAKRRGTAIAEETDT